MNMRLLKIYLTIVSTTIIISYGTAQSITIHADKPTVNLSPNLYGLFFEDINFAADGGLYAELIQNRSFEYFPVYSTFNSKGHLLEPMYAWEKKFVDGADGHIYVSRSLPLNANNPSNLELVITNNNGYAGVSNTGYDGIPLLQGEKYNFSFYCAIQKGDNEPMYQGKKIQAYIEDENGDILDFVEWTNDKINIGWTKYSHTFSPKHSTKKGKLTLLFHGKLNVKFDMVSLIPQNTYRGHGLRSDLVTALKDLKPAFLRFPGGCIVHGSGIENTYNWKETLGEVEQRKPKWNLWAYHQSFGLGYYEYFQLCEDLGAEPLPVMPVGVSCGWMKYECVPLNELDNVIQDALDLVEFANGGVDTKWGKIRADLGHPEPFNLKYVCLGNEEEDTPELLERFPIFAKAFQNKYPEIKLLGTSSPGDDVPLYDYMSKLGMWSSDEHYYEDPSWYIKNQTRFDKWDRTKAKVFIGEYASNGIKLINAISEAIFLTGVERNGDVVDMTAYAPLLARYGNTQWEKANMIYFNNEKVVLTPNYYVQQLFSLNKGDVSLKNELQNWLGDEVAVSTTMDKSSNEIIVKVVNAKSTAFTLQINLEGINKVAKEGKLITLKGERNDTNTEQDPNKVKPVTSVVKTAKKFNLLVQPNSLQILRVVSGK